MVVYWDEFVQRLLNIVSVYLSCYFVVYGYFDVIDGEVVQFERRHQPTISCGRTLKKGLCINWQGCVFPPCFLWLPLYWPFGSLSVCGFWAFAHWGNDLWNGRVDEVVVDPFYNVWALGEDHDCVVTSVFLLYVRFEVLDKCSMWMPHEYRK